MKTLTHTLFERILDAMPGRHLLIRADPPKFTIVYAVESYLQMVKRDLFSIVGKGVFEVFPTTMDESGEKSANSLLDSFMEAITTEKVHMLPAQRYDLYNEETRLFEEKFWRIRNSPVSNDEGVVTYIINSVEDITFDILSRRREEELKPMRKSHNLYLQAPLAIQIYTGPDLVIELANEPTLKIWGRGPEVIGKPYLEVFPELKGEGYELLMQEVIETGISKSFYERPAILKRNGKMEKLWFNFTYQPYYENDYDKAIGVLVFADEVTERVHARHLSEANLVLTEKNRELEQFAYIASHDLQEPLRKITFFIRMLEDSLGEPNDQSMYFIKKILSSSSRMSDLIRDILDFSKVSVVEEEFRNIKLQETITEIIADFDLELISSNARIITGKLPVIYGIPVQIRQLFYNLLSNALKFTRKDTSPVIKIRACKATREEVAGRPQLLQTQDYHLITVEDNGIGFEDMHSERIFGIFQRLHGKLDYEGTGIGLALCRKIAINHKGDIWATSIENEGSVFKVILPARIRP